MLVSTSKIYCFTHRLISALQPYGGSCEVAIVVAISCTPPQGRRGYRDSADAFARSWWLSQPHEQLCEVVAVATTPQMPLQGCGGCRNPMDGSERSWWLLRHLECLCKVRANVTSQFFVNLFIFLFYFKYNFLNKWVLSLVIFSPST